MKKFIVYLMVIVLTVSLGFAVYYLVDNREVISISTASIYTDVGKDFSIDVKYENKKSFGTISVTSSDNSVVSVHEETKEDTFTFTAESGGVARLVFTTSNDNFRNLYCDVIVGDGTATSPYYIGSVEQLAAIGAGELHTDGYYQGGVAYPVYNSNCCYKLISNIDASTYNNQYWIPLNRFSGILDGSGYTISGINIDEAGYAKYMSDLGSTVDVSTKFSNGVGLFSVVDIEAKVYNIKFENFEATGEYEYFGTVAGKNYGSVMRIEVKHAFLNVKKDASADKSYIGGIVGLNETTEDSNKIRHFARVDRCSINMTAGINYNTQDGSADYTKGMTGIIGGVVGYNKGATVIYSYSTGKINFAASDVLYGGIIGLNEYVQFSDQTGVDPEQNATVVYGSKYSGGNVKDCYSSLSTCMQAADTNKYAGLIGEVIDHKKDATTHEVVNNIMGLYYDKARLNNPQDGVTKNYNVGILTYKLDGAVQPLSDTKYISVGNTTADMKKKESYLSTSKNTIIYNEEGDFSEVKVVDVTWLFGSVWSIDGAVNDGYPVLNYNLLDLGEDFDANVYPTYNSVYTNVSMNDYAIAFKGYAKDSVLTLAKGETETLVVNPRNVAVTWSSADNNIATVVDGVVTGVNYGQTTITATTSLGKTAFITVFVSDTKYVISVDSDKVIAYQGTDTLNATVTPVKAGCDFWYVVSDETVATITDTGVITGHKVGDTTITIFYGIKESNTKYASATCNIKATCDDYSVVLSKGAVDIKVGDSTTITATVTPNDKVSWYTLNPEIATIVENGINSVQITGVKTGTATITAVIGSTTATCIVNVISNTVTPVTYTVEILHSDLSMVEDDIYPLSSHVTASDNSNTDNIPVSWSSSDNNVVSVSSSGVLTARSAGTAVITVSLVSNPNVKDTITVTVTAKTVTPTVTTLTVTLNTTSLPLYTLDTYQLNATTSESGISFRWESSNTNIVSVSSSGLVTAMSAGSAYVYAYVDTPNYQGSARCYITVSDRPVTPPPTPVSSISLSKTNISMFVNSTASLTVVVENCTIDSVTSNNTSLFTVSRSGSTVTVTSKSVTGSGTLTVTTSDGKIAKCSVSVNTFSVNLGSAKTITLGDSTTINATTNPSGYTVSWANHNPSIVSMSISGNTVTITANKGTTGKATITATCNGVTATTTVTVNPVTYTISMPSSVSVDESESKSITVTISSNLSNGYVDTSLVSWDRTSTYYTTSVSNNGGSYTLSISGTNAGSDTITVSIGNYSKSCTVTVNAVWSQYIYTLKQLRAMSQKLDVTYYLCADIDVGTGWTPIGTKSSPFTGKLEGKTNPSTNGSYKISGLGTSGATYAGLFGYTKGATIKNIIIDGCSVSGDYAGGLVGYANGGTYSNIIVKKTSVTATKYAGGVVGYLSSGTISYVEVSSSSSKEVKLNASSANYAVGGVVGYSTGVVNSADVYGSVTVNGSASDKSINIGGIAGYSSGTVKNSNVDCSEVKASSTAKGNVGGIVGYSTGLVQNCYTSTSVTANTSKSGSYAGGIVGLDMGGDTLTVSKCGVTDSTVKGYYAGGIVGSLSNTQTMSFTWKSSYYDKGYHKSRYLESSSYTVNVRECAVEGSVTVQGIYAGGLAGIISNGVISDSYTMASMKGVSGGQVKAGFAATIQSSGMTNLGGTGSVGVVIHCYSACTFASSNGTSYAITASNVHKYLKNNLQRDAGYVIDYLYDSDEAGSAKAPEFSGWTNNDSDKSTSDMQKSSTYTSFGFASTYWNLFNGQYITLKNISYPF